MAFSFTARLCRTNMHMRFRFEVRPDIDLTVYVRAWGVVGLERVGMRGNGVPTVFWVWNRILTLFS